ncbi:DNA-protecting protein DprA [Candidatus Falkowbacteria bacterium]|nr:DNA-protecting protein DprA [Candidatus Falkowbacteria bacterium]
MPQNRNLKYWLAFSQIRIIGATRFQKLIKRFPDLESAWRADLMALMDAGFEEKLAHEIIIARSQINPDQELEKLEKENLKPCLFIDEDYPTLLKQIFDPPALLYYHGSLNSLQNFCLAVVGTRKFSPYGKQTVLEIVADLSRQKITIVSGLAWGIDALAHEACLENSGLTAAILGSGADWQSIYPSTNRYLAKKIMENGGAVISEYPIGAIPAKQNFPLRNRIISGLSLGTLVIEAKESSGSLITAKYALDQNREVFAVPGSIYNKNSQANY